MDLLRGLRALPEAPYGEPTLDRRVAVGSLGYPWLVQRYLRSPISEDTLLPDEAPDLELTPGLLDMLDL